MPVRIKICGLTCIDDARQAVIAGADILGLVLAPESPRFVSPDRARDVAAAARHLAPGVRIAGVFVNTPAEEVAEALDRCGLDWAQLHGEEPAEWTAPGGLLHGRGYRVIRDAAGHMDGLPPPNGGDMPDVLIDARGAAARGGTGRLADWEAAARAARTRRLLLAGGLNPGNVAAAILRVHPWGVDVSSGVERSPGRKDAAAMRAFVVAARSADREMDND